MEIFDRILEHNIASQDVGERPIILHICNNGGPEMEETLIPKLEAVKGLAGYRIRTFDTNTGSFARITVMEDAIKEFPVEYFIMLDDDLYLPPKTGLATLASAGRPQQFSAWWGRYLDPHKGYFHSMLNSKDLQAGKGSVRKFHYCGGSSAVIDVDIVRFYSHLIWKVGIYTPHPP